jgi:DNA-binding XRE family transcriptional regulator
MKYPNKLRDIRKRTNANANNLADVLGVSFQHY